MNFCSFCIESSFGSQISNSRYFLFIFCSFYIGIRFDDLISNIRYFTLRLCNLPLESRFGGQISKTRYSFSIFVTFILRLIPSNIKYLIFKVCIFGFVISLLWQLTSVRKFCQLCQSFFQCLLCLRHIIF